MAELHPEATLVPSKLEMVTAWIGRQRWFVGLSEVPTLRLLHRWRLDDPAGEVGIEVIVVLDDPLDPTPYWLISTRDPEGLAAALPDNHYS